MLDHLVYVVQNLDAACDDLEGRLGVRPAFGGAHPGRGTHNALLDLGSGSYLEIIAPDPAQPEPPGPRRFGMDDLDGPRLVTWCIEPDDFDATVARARQAGYDPGKLVELSRERPDGVLLEWRLVTHTTTDLSRAAGGVVPFMIDWQGSPHPSATAPHGVELVGFSGEHPDPATVAPLLAAVGADLPLRAGPQPALQARLSGPRGQIELR